MVKMKEIAAQAGVSQATVSLILSNHPLSQRLSEKTRERVLKVVSQMKYRKNAVAHAMVTGKSRIIGFGAWTISQWHHAVTLEGIMHAVEDKGYLTKVFTFQRDNVFVPQVVDRIIEQRLSGLIAVNPPRELIDRFQADMPTYGIPVIYLQSAVRPKVQPRIFSDDALGCQLAVQHLFSQGHRRFAFLGQSPVPQSPYHIRCESVQREVATLGLELAPEHIYLTRGHETAEDIEHYTNEAADHLGRHPRRPTALICATDNIAAVAMRRLRLHRVQTPQDVSVIGFSDSPKCAVLDPALSSVHQPFYEMGKSAAQTLLRMIEPAGDKTKVPAVNLLPTRLILRASTGAARD